MVEPELTLFQMKIERMFVHTTKSREAGFGEAPEAFNPVDMGSTSGKFIAPMIDPKVLAVADIDQAIVPAPAVGVDDAAKFHASPNDGLERIFPAIRDDLGIHMPIALEDAEHGCLAECTSAPFALDALGAEIRFIDFDLAGKGRLRLTVFGNALTDTAQIPVDGVAVQARQNGDLSRFEIQCKQAHNLAKFRLADSRTVCIPVFHSHDSRLDSFH